MPCGADAELIAGAPTWPDRPIRPCRTPAQYTPADYGAAAAIQVLHNLTCALNRFGPLASTFVTSAGPGYSGGFLTS